MKSARPAAGWVYLAAFVAIGMSLQLLGPSLTYLRERSGSSKGEIAVLFIASSSGYLLGALSSGRLYDRGFGHRALAGGLLGIALAMLLLPQMSSRSGLCVVFAIVGASTGLVDVGGNTLVVWHSRGRGSNQLLNALHQCFGVGALIVPVLVNRSLAWAHSLAISSAAIATYATVVAMIVLLHAVPVDAPRPEVREADAETPRRVLAVIGAFFFLYVGVEIGFSGWLKTYAEGIHLPGANASTYINTLFFATFTLGRLLAVLLAKRVRAGVMLVGSCALTAACLVAMIVANGSPGGVWVTTGLIGLTMAPQYATMVAYAEHNISLSGRATSWFVSSSALGGLALPYLIGQLLDGSSRAMPVAVLVAAVACTAWVAVVRKTLVRARAGSAGSGGVQVGGGLAAAVDGEDRATDVARQG
ncbi:MAG TPA: MFS transporter [Ilumatobacteraceae bacterium]